MMRPATASELRSRTKFELLCMFVMLPFMFAGFAVGFLFTAVVIGYKAAEEFIFTLYAQEDKQ